MSSAYQINVMFFIECRHNLLSEGKTDTSIIFSPSLHIFVRVWPQQITEKASIRNISWSHNSFDLVETAELWWKSTVHAQDFFVNESSNRETVEAVGEGFPQFDIVSSLAFVVETINTVDGGALVVSSQEEEVLRVLYLVSQEKANCLKTLLASVHVVT